MSTQHLGEEYPILIEYCLHADSLAVLSAGHFIVLSHQHLLDGMVCGKTVEPVFMSHL